MEFRDAVNIVTAELTPQPWDYTASNGTTLTVTPAGLPETEGNAEVLIRITVDGKTAEVGVTTAAMGPLLRAIEMSAPWELVTGLYDELTVTPGADGSVTLTVTEVQYSPHRETATSIALPADQRLPLTSALRRAADVALGWEE